MVSFFISSGKKLILSLKARALVNRVIELGVCIGKLPAVHEELKAFNIIGVFRLTLCERRNFNGMIHNKGRLNKMLFNIFFKEKVKNITFLMAILKLNALFLGKSLCFFIGLNGRKINTGIFFDRVNHCYAFKRL